ncbi:MAG: multidrug effflux MFS transporter [Planctomycetes bacterium]|nr:multidrug effflux MFS transporter [Planctomycetota bacterium]MCH9727578.1 multidrug effflux MFS transporter [Planctomycetota bacterium]MCH9777442.1 multidrug effflux MFS transporter [Planctomycetota bacterium]MCH9790437.1 multidrug effflux MFS transporter [Planctomycetota bacterium]MDF1747037.1 multidrug effflux MFS transporter [Gimesia sp.]
MNHNSKPATIAFGEFVAMMAMMQSLVALSIDAMLPALTEIGQDLGADQVNDSQLIVSVLFLGLAFGQGIYGPLSDSTGRKPSVYLGFSLFFCGCLCSLFSTDFTVMLAGRFLQGLGLSAPRCIVVAIVRDQFEGPAMARVMSFVMTIFIFVPAVAPTLGQGILLVAHWRAIFAALLVCGVLTFFWFALRLPETLAENRRIPFSFERIKHAVYEVCSHRVSLGYTISLGLISSAFLGYLSSAQQIFQKQYELGTMFPLYFAILALCIGSASFANGRLVMRFGMQFLTRWSKRISTVISLFFFLYVLSVGGQPPLWSMMVYMMAILFCFGIMYGNLNAMAMEPLGHIAGVGSAVMGALSTLISVPGGIFIGHSYNGTVIPVISGFTISGVLIMAVMHWVESKNDKTMKEDANPD